MSRFGKAIFLGAVLVPLVGATAAWGVQGACCIPPSYQCFIMSHDQCQSLYGQWSGDGTVCSPNP